MSRPISPQLPACARWIALFAVLLLGACSNAPVVPSSQFPPPLLRKVPVVMGLYMDEQFRTYVHHDKLPNAPVQDVRVGAASQALFSDFLTAQFSSMLLLRQPPSADNVPRGVQAVLQPVVVEVQIANPKTERDEFHEAWIKYRLRLLTPQGQELTAWELAAYGKHRGAAIGGTNTALTAAVRDAMRDAAAGMALIFRDGEAFRARLAAASAASTGALPAAAGVAPPATAPGADPAAAPVPVAAPSPRALAPSGVTR